MSAILKCNFCCQKPCRYDEYGKHNMSYELELPEPCKNCGFAMCLTCMLEHASDGCFIYIDRLRKPLFTDDLLSPRLRSPGPDEYKCADCDTLAQQIRDTQREVLIRGADIVEKGAELEQLRHELKVAREEVRLAGLEVIKAVQNSQKDFERHREAMVKKNYEIEELQKRLPKKKRSVKEVFEPLDKAKVVIKK